MALFSWVSPALAADEYDRKIQELKNNIAASQQQIGSLQGQQDTLATKIAAMNAEINVISGQLRITVVKEFQVRDEIKKAEEQIDRKKAILDENIRILYQNSQVSTIELLASSENFGQFMDKQQYLEKVREDVMGSLDEVKALKAKLDEQQAQLAALIRDQKAQKDNLTLQNAQLSSLLAETQGLEANYQNLVKNDQKRIAQLRAQQAAANAAASRRVSSPGRSSGSGGACDGGQGNGGYPSNWCNAPFPNSYADSWGMYQRQCVSYTAWATAVRFGRRMPYWGGRGDAKQWPQNARNEGIPVNGVPAIGAVGIYTKGEYGHSMIVEQIKGDTVIVSSFNQGWDGKFSYDEWPISSLEFIHFR